MQRCTCSSVMALTCVQRRTEQYLLYELFKYGTRLAQLNVHAII